MDGRLNELCYKTKNDADFNIFLSQFDSQNLSKDLAYISPIFLNIT
jgi:hypothetical protein